MSEPKHQGLGPQDPIKSRPGWSCLLPQCGGGQEESWGLPTASPEPSLARNPVELNSVEKDRSRALRRLLAFLHACAYITRAFTLTYKRALKREKGNFFHYRFDIYTISPFSRKSELFLKNDGTLVPQAADIELSAFQP